MKRVTLTLIVICLALVASAADAKGPLVTTESLVLVYTTTKPDGRAKYKESSVHAVWVEDAKGKFVKTISVWGRKQQKQLTNWRRANGPKFDGVTGATPKAYGVNVAVWDLKNLKGEVVSDGQYLIQFELTNDDAGRNQFHRMTLGFKKDGVGLKESAPKRNGYEKITAIYTGRDDKALALSDVVIPKIAKPPRAAAPKAGVRRPPSRR